MRKTIFLSALLGLAGLFTFTACGEGEQTIETTLSVTPTSINVANAIDSTATFTITCDADWAIVGTPAWLTLSKTAGSGNASITVTVAAKNTDPEKRSASLLVTAGDKTATVLVEQSGTTSVNGFLYADLLGTFAANGRNDYADVPGVPTWDCRIGRPQGGTEEYWIMSNFANRGLNVPLFFNNEEPVVSKREVGKGEGSGEGYNAIFCAFYVNASTEQMTIFENYPLKWDARAKTLDATGKRDGYDIRVGVLAISAATGELGGVFTECYADLVFTMIAPESTPTVSGTPMIGHAQAGANGIIPLGVKVKSVRTVKY